LIVALRHSPAVNQPAQNQPPVESLDRVQILAAMGITAVVLIVIARLWLIWDQVYLLQVQWHEQAVGMGLGLGLLISAASSLVYFFWPKYRSSADYYLAMVLQPLTWIDLIWLGLLPGLSEEFLFRGVMLPALGLNTFALLISSLCFGVLHFSGPQNWSYVIWACVIGFVLGYSALATGNLLVPILAHIITNLVSSFVWKWTATQAKT
jgi:hypothetical protein